MTLEKAIEIQKQNLIDRHPYTRPEVNEATSLGIEALIRIYNNRVTTPGSNFIPLPGETED